MELVKQMCCQNCGGDIHQVSSDRWRCRNCGCYYDDASVQKQVEAMSQLLDAAKQEKIANLRRNLYEAVQAKYISNNDIRNICASIKQYLPDDFLADFYDVATRDNVKSITDFIRNIDVDEQYPLLDYVIPFLIRSMQTGFLLELNNLVERAFKKTDLVKFEEYSTQISNEATKVQAGVYETKLPRDVFVAYSSKDMSQVSKLVDFLEDEGLKCFVAARNLRHGKGAVENYDRALKEAMDHCKSFVFVSSTNSRSFDCDALNVEIEYIRTKDIQNAPPEYKNNYACMPQEYKKPRVEYRLEESRRQSVADEITHEFFDTYERVYTPKEVAKRVYQQIHQAPNAGVTAPNEPAKTKYCTRCQKECSADIKFCPDCGNTEFRSSRIPTPPPPPPVDTVYNPIRNICSYASCNFDNAFPTDGEYTDAINRDRYNVVYFHIKVARINKSKIKTRLVIYDAYNNKVLDDASDMDWRPNYDRLSLSWVVKGRDGEFVQNGNYRAEISVDGSPVQKYSFSVVSNNRMPSETKPPKKKPVAGVSPKSAGVALLLCWLFGFYGIHYFYVGRVGKGIFFLCTLGGFFGVGILIDFIRILCGKFKDKQGNYLRFKSSKSSQPS